MDLRALLLDTNAYSAFKRGFQDAIDIIQQASFIGINSVVLGELLGGFARGSREAQNRHDLQEFLESKRVVFFPIDERTAAHYSQIYANLTRKGQPIPTNDLWIAATALQHDLALFSFDDHFHRIDELVVGSTIEALSE